jgi:acetyltransferase
MLEHFFRPKSVAVVGASRDERAVGHAIFRNLISYGYQGRVYPINPKADELLGRPCFKSISELPEAVDLAVISVPGQIVRPVVEECGQKGIDAVVIISSGFKETGPEGAQREREVAEVARKYGVRIVGPNCLGIIVPSIGLSASFAADMPPAGGVAVLSQSGALAAAMLDWAVEEKVGFSSFVSFGNAADLTFSDFLEWLKDDEQTRVILAYMEGLPDGRRFMQVARQVTRNKPVVVVKGGVTSAGSRAVSSHTGSLAGSEQAYLAAFRQSGIIRADSVEHLYDFAIAFDWQPLPKGNNLAIVTNAGGPGILASDAAERSGVGLAQLGRDTVEKLTKLLPPAAAFYNPVDVLGDADEARYAGALEAVLSDPAVHGCAVLLTPQAMTRIPETAETVCAAARGEKPVLACFMGGKAVGPAEDRLLSGKVPFYPFPERCVAAFAAMTQYRRRLEMAEEEPPLLSRNTQAAARIIASVASQGRLQLTQMEARDVLAEYGFRVPPGGLAHTVEEAVQVANSVGYPVAIKVASPDILHKSDIGGVRLNLQTPQDVTDAFELVTFRARRLMPDAEIWGAVVQKMVRGLREVILGLSHDPTFGPLLMFGLGGVYVEALRDVSFRVSPIHRGEALEMLHEIRSYPLLVGVRGERGADIEAIVDCLLRVSQMACDFPNMVEMDVNPLLVGAAGEGATAVDARITLAGQAVSAQAPA